MSHSDFKAFQKSTQRSFVYDSLISQRGPERVRASPEATQPVSGRIVSWIHLLAHWTFSFSLGPFPILPSVLPDILFTESHRNPGDRQDRVSQSCFLLKPRKLMLRGVLCVIQSHGEGEVKVLGVLSTPPHRPLLLFVSTVNDLILQALRPSQSSLLHSCPFGKPLQVLQTPSQLPPLKPVPLDSGRSEGADSTGRGYFVLLQCLRVCRPLSDLGGPLATDPASGSRLLCNKEK